MARESVNNKVLPRAKRKTMKKLKFFTFTICLISFSVNFFSCTKSANQENTLSFYAMNTFMTIRSFGKNSKEANLKVQQRIFQIENELSVTKETSDVWKLNHSNGEPTIVSSETSALLHFAVDLAKKTQGAFNPCLYPITSAWGFTNENYRVPSQTEIQNLLSFVDYNKIEFSKNSNQENQISLQKNMMIDFGAIGKGFACDESIKILKENGIESAVLDLGGNVQVLGAKKNSKHQNVDWRIGIKNPDQSSPISAVAGLNLKNKAVVTSGGYERFFVDDDGKKYIHIFDSKTGKPVENEILSVTIIADSSLWADSLSTTLFVLGKDTAIDFWKDFPHKFSQSDFEISYPQILDFDFVILTNDNSIFYTQGIKDKIFFLADFDEKILVKR